MSARSAASRLDKGSSKRKIFGSRTMARPMATRWRWPPESMARLLLQPLVEVEDARRLVHLAADVLLTHLLHPEREGDVLEDGHVRVERVALEHHGDAALHRRQVVHPLSVDDDVARGRVLEPGDHAQERRLAAAGRADEDDELALAHVERDALHHVEVAEALDDVARAQAHPRGISFAAVGKGPRGAAAAGIGSGGGEAPTCTSSISSEALSSAACGSASPVTTDCTMAIMAFWKPL